MVVNMIEVQNLTKRYGTHMAVNHISFQVEEGEILGFLGPNGAGKSPTMNILTGYLAATEGQVTVAGHPLPEEADAAKGKERRVTFRMEGSDYDALCERCERAGLSKSEYLRYLVRIPLSTDANAGD